VKSRQVYRCHRVSRELRISGRIDDPLWKKAEVVRLKDTRRGATPRYRTEARLLHSRTALYVAFHCDDEYVWGTCRHRDEMLSDEECVELFISPSGEMFHYYELNVSPKNVVFDSVVINRLNRRDVRRGTTWSNWWDARSMKTRTYIKGKADTPGGAEFWRAEYRIPFVELAGAVRIPPWIGEQWLMNLYRIDAPSRIAPEYYAWCPTGIIDFHTPWNFGLLKFVK